MPILMTVCDLNTPPERGWECLSGLQGSNGATLMNCALLIDYYIYIYENWMYQIKIFASILIFLFIIHASNDILFSTYLVFPLKYSSLAYQNILFTLCDPDSVLISHLYLPHFPILFAFYAFTSPKKYK